MTVLASKYSCLVQTPCAKTAKSCAFCDSMPVLALELGTLFPNSAQAEFGGFGSRRLVSQSFLGAKAPLQPGFAKETAFFFAKAQKLKNSAKQNSWRVCRFTAFASGNSCFTNSRVQKLKNSAKPNS